MQCRASRKLLILDSCHSGGIRHIRGDANNNQPQAIQGAVREAQPQELGGSFTEAEGLLILAACRKNELSREDPAKGHGLFSYFLDQGLRGAADYARPEGIIDSDELYNYTFEKVVTESITTGSGLRQRPVRMIGEDALGRFAIARVRHPGGARPIRGDLANVQGVWSGQDR